MHWMDLYKSDDSSIVAFEHELCLVAWVLLTRLSQEHLDNAGTEYQVTMGQTLEALLNNIRMSTTTIPKTPGRK
jgi:hypothetical protein